MNSHEFSYANRLAAQGNGDGRFQAIEKLAGGDEVGNSQIVDVAPQHLSHILRRYAKLGSRISPQACHSPQFEKVVDLGAILRKLVAHQRGWPDPFSGHGAPLVASQWGRLSGRRSGLRRVVGSIPPRT